MFTPTITITLAELKTAARQRGYVARKQDGEFEIYPKGERGGESYFTADITDAFQTLRVSFNHREANKISAVLAQFLTEPHTRLKFALVTYAVTSGHCDWVDRLSHDWYRAGSTTVDSDTYSTLHRLRNHPNGRDILCKIANQ